MNEENIKQNNPLVETFGNQQRWVNHRNKVPCTATGMSASSTDPSTWSTYDEVYKASEQIGIVFTADQTLLGIDIDHCLQGSDIAHERQDTIIALIREADTYTEISPSGTGLHLFLIVNEALPLLANRKSPFECYTSGRYFTVTGIPFGESRPIRNVTSEEANRLLNLIGYPWSKEQVSKKEILSENVFSLSDSALVDKMFNSRNGAKIKRLYDGDISEYGNDASAADIALCSHLAFWTGRDTIQIDRIWSQSPLGARQKTQTREKGYRDRTIDAAIKNCKEIYKSKDATPKDQEQSIFLPAISHMNLMRQTFPPARFTIEPFFEQGTMNMVSAPPNNWKSWLFFCFAVCIASGKLVFNKFLTQKTNVMIVNEEDSARLIQDRLKMLNITDLELPIYYRISQGSKLTEEFVTNIIKEAKGKNIGIIMFDSLRAVHEADENDSTEMQKVMDLFKKITREDITVIFTHHHRKKSPTGRNDEVESTRGSSAINAAISGHISLEELKKDDGKILVVRHLKSKAGPKLPAFDLAIRIEPSIIDFNYLGEHKPKEQATNEAKERIISELNLRDQAMGRKDFIFLKIAGATTIKVATNMLVKSGEIKEIQRSEAKTAGMEIFNAEGKGNEKLYYIPKDDASDFFDD